MSSLEIEKLGPYRLQEVIGNGGMAKVYRATQEGDHGFSKPVALKLLKPQLAADPDAVDAFISEARLGSLLSHPHIVAVLNFGQLEHYYFLAMELMEGPTLFEVLTCHQRLQRRIPPAIVFQLIRQVCEGLSYAHQAMDRTGQPLNVIHRDLKPSNVLLSWHGVAKLGDFGVARAESNLLHTRVGGVAKGTAQYMAPEQAWGELELTPRTDLFALGLMLLHLLHLRHPYQAKSPQAMLRMAQEAQLQESIDGLPEMAGRATVQHLLTQLLQAEPARRFDSAEALSLALEGLQALYPPIRLVPWLQELRQAGLHPSAQVGVSAASENVSGKGEGRPSSGKRLASTPESGPQPPAAAQLLVTPIPSSQPSVPHPAQGGSASREHVDHNLPSQTLAIPAKSERAPRPPSAPAVMTSAVIESTLVVTKGRTASEHLRLEGQQSHDPAENARTELLSQLEVAEQLRLARAALEETTHAQSAPKRMQEVPSRSEQNSPALQDSLSIHMPMVEWPEESSQGFSAPLEPSWDADSRMRPMHAEATQPSRNLASLSGMWQASPVAVPHFPRETPPTPKAAEPMFGRAATVPPSAGVEGMKASAGVPRMQTPAVPRGVEPVTPLPPQTTRAPASLRTPPHSSPDPAPPAVPTASDGGAETSPAVSMRKQMMFIGLVVGLLIVGMVLLPPLMFKSGHQSSKGPHVAPPGVRGAPPEKAPDRTPPAHSPSEGGSPMAVTPKPAPRAQGSSSAPEPINERDILQDSKTPPVTAPTLPPESAEPSLIPSNSAVQGYGYVTLNTVPSGQLVAVDDDDPRTVPVSRLKLTAGPSHVIQFYCDETLSKELRITLKAEERRTIVWDCRRNVFQRER